MMRTWRVALAAVLLALVMGAAAVGAEPGNLLKDPGFESVKDGAFSLWSTPAYWQGTLAVANQAGQAHGGRSCAELAAAEKGGKWWGRTLNEVRPAITQGARYRLSVWAKGKGELIVGCIEYGQKEGKTSYHYAPLEQAAALTDAWQQVTFYYVPQDLTAMSIAPYAEVRGQEGRALLDDAFFGPEPVPGYSLTVRAAHTMMPVGGTLAIQVQAAGPEGHAQTAVSLRRLGTENPLVEEVALGAGGKGEYLLRAGEGAAPGVITLSLALKDAGIADPAYVDVVDAATYQRFADAAAKVQLQKPAHLLFVGDSLTAFYKGYNYVDKVRGWLQSRFGEEVAVTNAGVGGDYTTRVLARLEGDVLAKKPTHVFIFLGHNDSKLKSTTEYKEAVVPPDVFEKEYREIVQRVRATGANVTIISATSSVYEITKATAEAASKAGRAHSFFGKPEALEQFNAIARKVAGECGCGYLDVYEPTRTHPDKPSLFTPDGVHVNNAGNQLLALQILDYLGKP